jgi:hypothetical protein
MTRAEDDGAGKKSNKSPSVGLSVCPAREAGKLVAWGLPFSLKMNNW